MATVGQQLTAPEAGWKRYDDKHSALKYTGTIVNNGGSSFYLNTGTSLEGVGDKLSFSFTGTKLTIMVYGDSGSSFSIMIDGVNEGVGKAFGYGVNRVIVAYTNEMLSNSRHEVELTMLSYDSVGGNRQRVIFDAIDIDSNGRLLHPDEVTDLKDLDVGKRIRCHYQASSGAVGGFSGLGQETSDFIPITSSATPNGDFYFIVVEDWNKKKILIVDRNIQHSISWDTLNAAGIASGIILPKTVFGYDAHTSTTASDLGVTIADTDDNSGASYKIARVSNGVDAGKWYFEVTAVSSSSRGYRSIFGVINKNSVISNGNGANYQEFLDSVNEVSAYSGSDGKIISKQNVVSVSTLTIGDTVGIALNLDDGKIAYYKNGTLMHESQIDASVEWYPFHASKWLSKDTFNFGYKKFKYNIPDGYKPYEENSNKGKIIKARLLTGGISSSDKDNEWDKYIVNSTLNGFISAGDNSVWNAGTLWSWSSTTSTTPTHRAIRGGGLIGAWDGGNPGSHYVGSNVGFRPALEIEFISPYRSFVFHDGEYKKYDTEWQTISTTLPSVDTFTIEGIDDLSIFDRKSIRINIPMDDNTPSGEVLGNGKVFKEKVDLKRYFQINSIKVK